MFDSIKLPLRLLWLQWKYRGRGIKTPFIAGGVELGRPCLIDRQVELGQGVKIGAYTYINIGTCIASGNIGKFSSIGYYCQIGMHEHPIRHLSMSPFLYGERNIFGASASWDDRAAPPVIGNDVWIGSHATILQEVTIGDGAVIAAGSVVTKDIPAYAITVGAPARVLRYRFPEETIAQLLQWRWWDLPIEKIQEMQNIIHAGENWQETLHQVLQVSSP